MYFTILTIGSLIILAGFIAVLVAWWFGVRWEETARRIKND